MRQVISGFLAAAAAIAAGAVPANACGGLFDSCSACGYVSACPTAYVPGPAYGYCGGCGWIGYERLPDPAVQYHSRVTGSPQYYYVNQGPTYTGAGNIAPYRYYEESAISGWGPRRYASRHRGPVVRSLY